VFRSYGDARQLAQLLNNCHPVFALSGDIGNARRFVDEAITVAERYGLRTQVAWATFNLGCTLVLEGNLERGISTMIAGMTAHEEAGNRIKTWMLGPLTNAYRLLGSVNEGFEIAERAFKLAEESGERLWLSEIHRLYGELILLDRGASSEAERRFRIAISIAREQQAKSWELRATICLDFLTAECPRPAGTLLIEATAHISIEQADSPFSTDVAVELQRLTPEHETEVVDTGHYSTPPGLTVASSAHYDVVLRTRRSCQVVPRDYRVVARQNGLARGRVTLENILLTIIFIKERP
jgi:MalT-like TPR region